MTRAEIGSFPALVGVGAYRPERIVLNAELAENGMDTSDEAIQRLTQIKQRHAAGPGEQPSDMGAVAVERCLESAHMIRNEETGLYEPLGGLYVSTITKDYGRIMPDIAPEVARKAGLGSDMALVDVGGACAGFLIAIKVATAVAQVDRLPTLAAGVGHMFPITNFRNRRTGILFGTGAGAGVVAPAEDVLQPTFADFNISDPDAIYVHGTEEPEPEYPDVAGKIIMDGHLVSAYAKRLMPGAAIKVAQKAGFYNEQERQIDWDKITLVVPHQANGHLIDALAQSLNAPKDIVYSTVAEDANTSAASIPLALDHAIKAGKFNQEGRNVVLLVAIGAGMVATACIIELKLP